MARHRKPNIYDNEIYNHFGEQPYLFEIQLGYELIPLTLNGAETSLQKEITLCRNQVDSEYGLPLPSVHVRDNMCLEPDEYTILLNGVEVGRSTLKEGHQLCIDTGSVFKPIERPICYRTKDPAYGLDAFFVRDEEAPEYEDAGYVCLPPEKVIKAHLYEIIKKNRTKILDQNLVHTLIEKVRRKNPDVISDVFFVHQFSISDFKCLLNYLLEEEISIRDMNTILETVADYAKEKKHIYELGEKVREQLSYDFIRKYADENKDLHVLKVEEDICELLVENGIYPSSQKDIPYCPLNPKDRKRLMDLITKALPLLTDKGYTPVLLCISGARQLLSSVFHKELPSVRVISDLELYALKSDINIHVEGVLTFDEQKK